MACDDVCNMCKEPDLCMFPLRSVGGSVVTDFVIFLTTLNDVIFQ
jgi:hypothetical protein